MNMNRLTLADWTYRKIQRRSEQNAIIVFTYVYCMNCVCIECAQIIIQLLDASKVLSFTIQTCFVHTHTYIQTENVCWYAFR